MALRYTLFAVMVLLLPGCGAETGEPDSGSIDLSHLLPESSSLEGWNIGEGPVEYHPDNLYEYLNGAAPRYLGYGFRKLLHVRYELGGDILSSVTLDILDMGTVQGAFGLFRNGMPADVVLRDWGTEGYRSGTVAAAWKDRIFVQAEMDDDRAVLISMLDRLMTWAGSEVRGDAALPEILTRLPSEGRIPLSERYVAADLFGHTFLPEGVLAGYSIEESEAELFFSDLGSENAAGEAMARLRDYHSQWGTIIHEVPSPGSDGYRFSDPGLDSGIVVRVDRYLAGVHGDLSYEAQLRLLTRLADRLVDVP
ncbi:DUF6599 family protein [Gemmatimonadota bacterium]